ncbi:MAG: hypothetical protein KME26_12445 [Oscillatoria princeps RMCB-10]|nr:hypothetical protein [Oscillatoria princeps RMCB-10]
MRFPGAGSGSAVEPRRPHRQWPPPELDRPRRCRLPQPFESELFLALRSPSAGTASELPEQRTLTGWAQSRLCCV